MKQFPDDVDIVENTEGFPNVIVIMKESFSDLALAYDMELAEDPIAYFQEIVNGDNVVSGIMHSSQFGGGTANIEYECLTQNETAFLPTGSMPYQQYIKSEIPSLASRLNELGYTTTAIHPYYGSGWCRNIVYPLLGFDQMIFKDDFAAPKKIRNYISDESAFQKIIELYEEKASVKNSLPLKLPCRIMAVTVRMWKTLMSPYISQMK